MMNENMPMTSAALGSPFLVPQSLTEKVDERIAHLTKQLDECKRLKELLDANKQVEEILSLIRNVY